MSNAIDQDKEPQIDLNQSQSGSSIDVMSAIEESVQEKDVSSQKFASDRDALMRGRLVEIVKKGRVNAENAFQFGLDFIPGVAQGMSYKDEQSWFALANVYEATNKVIHLKIDNVTKVFNRLLASLGLAHEEDKAEEKKKKKPVDQETYIENDISKIQQKKLRKIPEPFSINYLIDRINFQINQVAPQIKEKQFPIKRDFHLINELINYDSLHIDNAWYDLRGTKPVEEPDKVNTSMIEIFSNVEFNESKDKYLLSYMEGCRIEFENQTIDDYLKAPFFDSLPEDPFDNVHKILPELYNHDSQENYLCLIDDTKKNIVSMDEHEMENFKITSQIMDDPIAQDPAIQLNLNIDSYDPIEECFKYGNINFDEDENDIIKNDSSDQKDKPKAEQKKKTKQKHIKIKFDYNEVCKVDVEKFKKSHPLKFPDEDNVLIKDVKPDSRPELLRPINTMESMDNISKYYFLPNIETNREFFDKMKEYKDEKNNTFNKQPVDMNSAIMDYGLPLREDDHSTNPEAHTGSTLPVSQSAFSQIFANFPGDLRLQFSDLSNFFEKRLHLKNRPRDESLQHLLYEEVLRADIKKLKKKLWSIIEEYLNKGQSVKFSELKKDISCEANGYFTDVTLFQCLLFLSNEKELMLKPIENHSNIIVSKYVEEEESMNVES